MKTFVTLLNGLYSQGYLKDKDGASGLYDLNFFSFRPVDIPTFRPLTNLRRDVLIQRILVMNELDNGIQDNNRILIKIFEFLHPEQFPSKNITTADLTDLTPSDFISVDGGCEFEYRQGSATVFNGAWPQCLVGFRNVPYTF